MDRHEATSRISQLVGRDIRSLADELGVTVWKDGKLNKGWAGHAIERYLGLPLNSSRSPNLGSWELKVVSLKRSRQGRLQVKETMWITMIDPVEVAEKEFEDSHLFVKLRRILVVSRTFESKEEERTLLHGVASFTLDDPYVYRTVKSDYDLVRRTIIEQGFDHLTGYMGELIQPRTKGPGHGSTSRAFYARAQFVANIVGV